MKRFSLENIRHAARGKIWACLLLVLVADIFFYDQPAGWTAGGFCLLLLTAIVVFNPESVRTKTGRIAMLLTFGQCLLLVNDPNKLSIILFIAGVASIDLTSRGVIYDDALAWLRRVVRFILSAIVKPFSNWPRHVRAVKRRRGGGRIESSLRGWTLPVVLTAVFILLFGSANPILGNLLRAIKWDEFLPDLSWQRLLFWLFTGAVCWRVIRPRLHANRIVARPKSRSHLVEWLFSGAAILRSLVIFNILFAAQTAMDAAYLWGGAKLPDGMTYAQYAHQGAYPLIVTALLAAAFVLIVMRPGSGSAQSRLIRGLVYGWVGQNVFLVISSIWRTDLYVQEYSLTYLRLSALIWMVLVATGLILIVARMVFARSNTWLINANGLALLLVLYACSATNLGGLIADYNVRHCREVTGQGNPLDVSYLEEIGPSALPALFWLESHDQKEILPRTLKSSLDARQKNWRSWTFQGYLLSQYAQETMKGPM